MKKKVRGLQKHAGYRLSIHIGRDATTECPIRCMLLDASSSTESTRLHESWLIGTISVAPRNVWSKKKHCRQSHTSGCCRDESPLPSFPQDRNLLVDIRSTTHVVEPRQHLLAKKPLVAHVVPICIGKTWSSNTMRALESCVWQNAILRTFWCSHCFFFCFENDKRILNNVASAFSRLSVPWFQCVAPSPIASPKLVSQAS